MLLLFLREFSFYTLLNKYLIIDKNLHDFKSNQLTNDKYLIFSYLLKIKK